MIEKLKMQTPDVTDQNIDQIAKLFPHVLTETIDANGNTIKAIDFDLLKQSLSDVLVDDESERYRLDWPGKKASLLKANTPITKTLRPCREESVNFDTTENVYIEGDNFEVLKILQESYLGKIKMIYIDPPYNTGSDFIYKDTFKISKEEYEEEIGAVDEDGDKLFKNTDSNGRFHSDWLSMMYERMVVARDLLKEDGVIFISIDDGEVQNLRKVCDEIFGEDNFIACIVWQKRTSPDMRTAISDAHEYFLIYGKDYRSSTESFNKLPLNNEQKARYKNPDKDIRGPWVSSDFTAQGFRPNQMYIIKTPSGVEYSPPESRCWKNVESSFLQQVEEGRFWFGKDGSSVPRRKTYLSETEGYVPWTWWTNKDTGHSQQAKKEINALFEKAEVFSTPKPILALRRMMEIATSQNDLILDFFSGSATTAHAVMQLNAEDNGKRKFIMVQLPEETDKKSEAYRAGYKTITEIGKERIRRAGNKIVEDSKEKEGIENLDIGFRVYKTDSTNIKDVYYHPEALEQDDIFDLKNNIKDGRTPDDLLTQVILDLGLELNLPIEKKEILGNTVFIVQTNALVACFDDNINFKIVDEIAELKPFKVVFKDASFADDKDRINVEERFKRLSPETVITVI